MTTAKSEFLRQAEARGFVHQCTDLDGLDDALAGEGPVTAYIGFDCTATSLHVGSLVPIMLLRLLQNTG
ncbi:MAG: tyrosine--tRNA ligase, partial [Gemmatimonadetes bacterium]|nr:tyrosine--tRNA ligase [Gemmatimonadota bacterium]